MKKIVLTVALAAFILGSAFPKNYQIPLIGEKAPSIKVLSTNGNITFPECFGDSWKILFSHPQDFTPVCSSEVLELAYLQDDFEKLGVKVAVISTDNIEQHEMWKAYLEEIDYKGRGAQTINFPIIDDHEYKSSMAYGMIHEEASSVKDVRGVFVMDSNNIVRAVYFYPMNVGRNMNEIIRTVTALQESEKDNVVMPANWEVGDDVLMSHFPYTEEEISANPSLKENYYSVANRMWFKKTGEK